MYSYMHILVFKLYKKMSMDLLTFQLALSLFMNFIMFNTWLCPYRTIDTSLNADMSCGVRFSIMCSYKQKDIYRYSYVEKHIFFGFNSTCYLAFYMFLAFFLIVKCNFAVSQWPINNILSKIRHLLTDRRMLLILFSQNRYMYPPMCYCDSLKKLQRRYSSYDKNISLPPPTKVYSTFMQKTDTNSA